MKVSLEIGADFLVDCTSKHNLLRLMLHGFVERASFMFIHLHFPPKLIYQLKSTCLRRAGLK